MTLMDRRMLLAGAVGAGLMLAGAPAAAQEREAPRRIVVTGEGEFAVAPDLAVLSLTVMREADTAADAMTQASAAMTDVIAAMKEAGVLARDLQTAGLQISPQYDYSSQSDRSPRANGYQAQNTLVVRVRDLAQLGFMIDRAVSLGVNQGANITLTNDDPSAAITEARKRAVADAVARARTLAEASGTRLGQIMEISERSETAQPMPVGKAFRADAAPAAVPVELGENSYRVTVTVTFALEG
jgi:uncharacterized protein YggE